MKKFADSRVEMEKLWDKHLKKGKKDRRATPSAGGDGREHYRRKNKGLVDVIEKEQKRQNIKPFQGKY